MKKISFLFLLLIVGAVVGGGLFLSTWELPAPKSTIEKVIPNDRFPN